MRRVALGVALLLGALAPTVAVAAFCQTTIIYGANGRITICRTCCPETPYGSCSVVCSE